MYRFDTKEGCIVQFEDESSMAARFAIPSLWLATDSEGKQSVHLDMASLAALNMTSKDVVLWGVGTVGESGDFTFTASQYADGSCLYVIVDVMLALLMGPSLATVGVYSYNQRSTHLDHAKINAEEFREPTDAERSLDGFGGPDAVNECSARALDLIKDTFGSLTPLVDAMAGATVKAGGDEVTVPKNFKVEDLFN